MTLNTTPCSPDFEISPMVPLLPPTTPDQFNLPYATHEGSMTIMGKTLRVYQLSDGKRVFNAEDVNEFFGLEGE